MTVEEQRLPIEAVKGKANICLCKEFLLVGHRRDGEWEDDPNTTVHFGRLWEE